jgi:hypothetical protein
MKQWVARIIIAAIVITAGYWLWTFFFPPAEQVIRKRLHEVAKLASFNHTEAPLAKLANSQKLANYGTADVTIVVNAPNRRVHSLSGRDDLFQALMAARSNLTSLSVEFLDIVVKVGPDKESAVANLTAKASVPSDRDMMIQEFRITLKKVGGDWLIWRLETVRTLT